MSLRRVDAPTIQPTQTGGVEARRSTGDGEGLDAIRGQGTLPGGTAAANRTGAADAGGVAHLHTINGKAPLATVSGKSDAIYAALGDDLSAKLDARLAGASKAERKDMEKLLHFAWNGRGDKTSAERLTARTAVAAYLAEGGGVGGAKADARPDARAVDERRQPGDQQPQGRRGARDRPARQAAAVQPEGAGRAGGVPADGRHPPRLPGGAGRRRKDGHRQRPRGARPRPERPAPDPQHGDGLHAGRGAGREHRLLRAEAPGRPRRVRPGGLETLQHAGHRARLHALLPRDQSGPGGERRSAAEPRRGAPALPAGRERDHRPLQRPRQLHGARGEDRGRAGQDRGHGAHRRPLHGQPDRHERSRLDRPGRLHQDSLGRKPRPVASRTSTSSFRSRTTRTRSACC